MNKLGLCIVLLLVFVVGCSGSFTVDYDVTIDKIESDTLHKNITVSSGNPVDVLFNGISYTIEVISADVNIQSVVLSINGRETTFHKGDLLLTGGLEVYVYDITIRSMEHFDVSVDVYLTPYIPLNNLDNLFWQTSTIGIEMMKIYPSSVYEKRDSITLRNNLPNTVTIGGIWVGSTVRSRNAPDAVNLLVDSGLFPTSSTPLFPGQNVTVSNISLLDCYPGEDIRVYVKIMYEDWSTGAVFNYTAQDYPYYTVCASE